MDEKETLTLCPECYKALEVESPAHANPWRYVERDGNPETPGKYEVSAVFGDVPDRADLYWSGEYWWWSEVPTTDEEDLTEFVYAWHEMPEPAPPLEPEGEQR